ncbi:alpha/beta hydrolase [Kitasatospora sp. NBC_00458]|uniref:alpha/beta hydrolase n=1 Tax=Kitasatospora sp. NBC_00458 TaxID=2903568 RepID=UPI002E17E394
MTPPVPSTDPADPADPAGPAPAATGPRSADDSRSLPDPPPSPHNERAATVPRSRKAALLTVVAALLALSPAVVAVAARSDAPAAPGTSATGPATGPAALPPGAEQAAADTKTRLAAENIVDIPVRFTVQNVNRTLAACPVDGKTYQVSGHLTAPKAVIDGGAGKRAVTLYEHGIAAGEWYWRLDAPGYHHTEELAKKGHASLTIDRIGYGASDKPDGFGSCIGGQADIAHQIVEQLRAGSYRTEQPGQAAVPFDKVVLAGQSNGSQVSQIEAYSFQDVDGLVVMDWTDLGLTPQANARFFSSLQTCLRGGSAVDGAGGPGGYAYYDLGTEEFKSGNFHDTEPGVLALSAPHQNRHPCGDMASQLGSVLVDMRHIKDIRIPVLFLYGEKDARVQGGAEHRALFTGATDTKLVEVPAAGHYMGMARNAPQVHTALADWLAGHQLG